MKHGWLMAGLIALLMGSAVGAERLSLDDFLDRVQAVHPLFQAERLANEIAAAEVEAARGGEGWVLAATPSLGTEEPVSNSSFSPSDSTTLGMGVDLTRAYWKTGSRLGLNWDYRYQEQEAATVPIFGPDGRQTEFETGLPEFHQHGLFLAFTQPLLKNRGGDQDRLAADLREIAARAQRLRSREVEEDFLLRIGGRYLDWVLQIREATIAEQRAKLAATQLEVINRRRLQNQAAQVDVLRAQSDLNTARQSVLRAQLSRDAIAAELAVLAQLTTPPVQASDNLLATNPVQLAGEKLPENIRVIRLFSFEAERLLREAEGLVGAERPQLDLDLSAGLSGGDATFGESASLDQPSARAALVFRYPLGNRVAKKQVQVNRLEREQILAQQQQTELQLHSTIRNLEIQLAQVRVLLDLSARQIDLAEQRSDEELTQYRQGNSPLTFVIQSQDATAAAQVLHVRTAASLQKLVLEHRALLDRLLPTK